MLAGNKDTDRMEVWVIENGDSERSVPAQQLITRPVLAKVSINLPPAVILRDLVADPQAEGQCNSLR